jgi:hypothetical protein
MKQLFLAVLFMAPAAALACPTGTIELKDNLAGTDGSPWAGTITDELDYPSTNAGVTFVGQMQTTKILAGAAGALDACRVPGVYSVTKTSAATAAVGSLSVATAWVIPTTGGPYKLTDVPSGIVNISSPPSVLAWVSGINFASVRKGSIVVIGTAPSAANYIAGAPTGAITLPVTGNAGTQSGVAWNNGAIEQQPAVPPLPMTVSGPQGPPGPAGTAPSGEALLVLATPSAPGAARLLALTHSYLPEGAPPLSGTWCVQATNGVVAWGACGAAAGLSWANLMNSQWTGMTNSQWTGMTN